MADDNAEAYSVLESLKAQLMGLKSADTDVAKDAAEELKTLLLAQIAAGVDPQGKPWAPTKDGRRPLVNAAEALEVTSLGTVVIARLKGPTALHHLGLANGGITRQILPTRGLPQALITALQVVVKRRLLEDL